MEAHDECITEGSVVLKGKMGSLAHTCVMSKGKGTGDTCVPKNLHVGGLGNNAGQLRIHAPLPHYSAENTFATSWHTAQCTSLI